MSGYKYLIFSIADGINIFGIINTQRINVFEIRTTERLKLLTLV
jgi:hypothetical protein